MHLVFCTIGTLGDVYPVIAYAQRITRSHDSKIKRKTFITNQAHSKLEWDRLLPEFNILYVGTNEQYQEMVGSEKSWRDETCRDHHFQTGAIHTFANMYRQIEKIYKTNTKAELYVYSTRICLGALWACQRYELSWIKLNVSPSDYRHPHYLPIAKYGDLNTDKLPRITRDVVQGYWRHEDLKRDPYNLVLQNRVRKHIELEELTLENEFDLPRIYDEVCLYPKDMDNIYEGNITVFNDHDSLPRIQKHHLKIRPDEPYIVRVYGSGYTVSWEEYQEFNDVCVAVNRVGIIISNKSFKEVVNAKALIFNNVDLPYLFEKADCVIHHGGIGTIADALNVGAAQYVIPKAFDQFDNALRLQWLGLGVSRKDYSELPAFLERLRANNHESEISTDARRYTQAGNGGSF